MTDDVSISDSTDQLKTSRRHRRTSTADRRLRMAQRACYVTWLVLALVFAEASGTESASRVRRHCPSCVAAAAAAAAAASASSVHSTAKSGAVDSGASHGESARLESIKRQILIKLGLSAKPQLPADAVPPRDVIMETLQRAEESAAGLDRTTPATSAPSSGRRSSHQQHQQQQQHPASDASESSAVEEDFYGKTSEIIAFAEPGPKLNGQTLAEFSRVQETAPEPSLRVKSATLWLYVKIKSGAKHSSTTTTTTTTTTDGGARGRHQQQHLDAGGKRPPTLYVFRVLAGHRSHDSNASIDQNWSELVASERITLQHSGWTKVNMTDGVSKWFSSGSSGGGGGTTQRLRLLVDCSGCGAHVEPVLFESATPHDADASGKGKKRRRRRRRRRRLMPGDADADDELPLADGPPAKHRKKHNNSNNNNNNNNNKKHVQHQQQQANHNKHRPFLVVHTDSSASRRLRRRTPLDCSPTTSACCKQRFFVSFRALGWDDWIIAPSGYYANYCRGDCGGGPAGRTPDTFINYHSHVIDELRKLPQAGNRLNRSPAEHEAGSNGTALASPSGAHRPSFQQHGQQQHTGAGFNHDEHQQMLASLQPCCAPTKFSSMSLIYFGPDMNIIKRDLPKMVVDECGCP